MSNDALPINDLERGPSAKFPELGASYKGRIISVRRTPQTDFDTGEVMHWNDGSERMQTLVGLDLGNGETTTLYARGGKYDAVEGKGMSMEGAIVAAVRAAGDDAIRVGAELAISHTGLGKVAKKGMNAPKLYTAEYRPPVVAVPVDSLFTDED